MADTTSYKKALQDFYNNFQKTNSDFKLSNKEKKANNIDAVNKLLDTFVSSSSERAKVQDLLTSKNENAMYGNSNSLFPALPSFNARTPYIEIWVNGILLVPNTNIDDLAYVDPNTMSATSDGTITNISINSNSTSLTNADLFGQGGRTSLDVNFNNLDLEMPIGGVLSTITGTLTLYSRTPIEFLSFLTDDGATTDSAGLPQCRLRFGWNIARTDGQVEKLLTPFMTFLIMNISMSDPGKTMGSEFTLTLQDAGSAVLQNSSADIGLTENWPQVQLRIILEKFLGLRLFTLDDLLLLGENQNNKQNFNLGSLKTSFANKDQVINAIGLLSADPNNTLTQQDILNLQTNFLTSYNNEKSSGASDQDAINKALVSDKTFFVTNPTPAIRLNSNVFETTIKQLLTKIVCRWYPTSNQGLTKEVSDSLDAEAKIRDLKAKFDQDGVLSQDDLATFEKEQEKLASACVLVWIPHFPAGLYTSSNMLFGSDIVNEEGAFILLPKETTDYSLNAVNLPVIYGPGGSSLPYFYGGAQNVFSRISDTMLASPKHFSTRVGEVLDITSNYSNLIAVMKASYNEQMCYKETGKFLTPFQTVQESKEDKKLKQQQQKDRLEAEKQKLLSQTGGDPQQFINKWEAANLPKFKAIRGRFKQSIAPRYLVNSVEVSNDPTNYPAKTYAQNVLRHRIATFLNYPYTVGMSLMGDPYLIRQGIGVFELINYYPTMDGINFKYNPFLSGVYLPQKISHKITLGDYTTEIQAVKVPDSITDSAKGKIQSIVTLANKTTAANQAQADEMGTALLYQNALQNVNLDTFQTIPGDGYSIYKLTADQQNKLNTDEKIFTTKLDLYTQQQKNKLMTKYNVTTWQEARSKEITNFEITEISSFIDADTTLSESEKLALKGKVKTTHNVVLSPDQVKSIFQQTIGGAVVDSTGNIVTSNASKLDSLYSQLKTSRYEDIRNALNQQVKKN